MTAVVGVLCKDGVVIGSDSSTTFVHEQFRTIEQCSEKLEVLVDCVIVAGTGQVGLGQRFCAIVEDAWQQDVFQKPAMEVAILLSRATIENFRATFMNPGQYGALVAFPAEKGIHLCEFDTANFQPEFKTEQLWFCSMGSAQPITDPFLALMREVFWQEGLPSVNDGVFAVAWTLEHAIAVNPGGVNAPVRLAVVEHGNDGAAHARMLDEAELYEHSQNIEEAKNLLREFRGKHLAMDQGDVPDIPQL